MAAKVRSTLTVDELLNSTYIDMIKGALKPWVRSKWEEGSTLSDLMHEAERQEAMKPRPTGSGVEEGDRYKPRGTPRNNNLATKGKDERILPLLEVQGWINDCPVRILLDCGGSTDYISRKACRTYVIATERTGGHSLPNTEMVSRVNHCTGQNR